MAKQLFANNRFTQLNQFVDATDLSFRVADGSSFPTPGPDEYFLITVIANGGNISSSTMEIMKVTSNVNNVFTVERAQEGTAQVAFLFGSQVEMHITAGTMNNFLQASDPNNTANLQFTQSGTGAVMRSMLSKMRDIVNVKDFGAGAGGDDTVKMQNAINALNINSGTLYIPNGTYTISTKLTVTQNNIRIIAEPGAVINYNTPDFIALQVSGTNFRMEGGQWVGPAVWDGTNVTPTYAVMMMQAAGARIHDVTLINIRKVGVWFKDTAECAATSCTLLGNYPSALWTGVETVHFGFLLDPDTGTSGGNFRITDCTIKQCVQGVFVGNYGPGQIVRGSLVANNTFESCWNHGIYSNYTYGLVVDGNNFNRCQLPVVVSGQYNVVSDNSMFTVSATVGDERDIVGISARDASFTVITGNTIRGVVVPAASVVISVQYFGTIAGPMTGNVISNNSIDILDGFATPIRIFAGTGSMVTQNIVSNNTIRAKISLEGAISLSAPAAGISSGNKVHDNTITFLGLQATGGAYGVFFNNILFSTSVNNSISYDFDAASATVGAATLFTGQTIQCCAEHNSVIVNFNWGANLNLYGTYELGASVALNSSRYNNNCLNTSKTATYFPVVAVDGSNLLVQEMGEGAPAFPARIGSIWQRYPFGGPAATLYVKETGTSGAGWAAK